MNIAIVGSKGRMGQALLACARLQPRIDVVGVDIGDSIEIVIGSIDVVLDFSSPDAIEPLSRICAEERKPLVIGTTGHSEDQEAIIQHRAKEIPIVKATNFSTGVNTLFWLTRKAAEILGTGYDLGITEIHHRHKKDAPSGTARTLGTILMDVLWKRKDLRTVPVHSFRIGDVAGDHTVIFAGNGERLELTHKASSRDTFANGALRAAQWIVGKPPGLYDMQDVLGLK